MGKTRKCVTLKNGATVANFSIATSESYTDKVTGQKVENTDWHDIVVWRGLADVVDKYVRKGQKVYIEGKLKKRSWQDKDGNTRYTTEVVADELTILTRLDKPEGTSAPYESQGTPNQPSKVDDIIKNDKNDLPF